MTRSRPRAVTASLAALALVAGGLLGGCSDDDALPDVDTHDDADVSFAAEMIPHHEQALRMVDMTEGRTLSPDFEELTEAIEDAQEPEIELMEGWLDDWGEEPADDSSGMGDHAGMDGSMDGMDGMEGMDGSMPGMMSEDDLSGLEGRHGSAFERMWLRMMIDHHEGAVEMARTEIAKGTYRPALDLAASIVESQTREIEQMRQMLGS